MGMLPACTGAYAAVATRCTIPLTGARRTLPSASVCVRALRPSSSKCVISASTACSCAVPPLIRASACPCVTRSPSITYSASTMPLTIAVTGVSCV